MKKLLILCFYLLLASMAHAQITTSKVGGGSVVTKLGMGVSVNKNSTLSREWIILNNEKCPLQLDNVGINTSYLSSSYYFSPTGSIKVKEPIFAYEIHHVLYDVFGGHIKTLSNTDVSDLENTIELKQTASWYATENNVREYLLCVSYVATVRTKSGIVWHYNSDEIKQELNKIQIAYEEGYKPSNEKTEK